MSQKTTIKSLRMNDHFRYGLTDDFDKLINVRRRCSVVDDGTAGHRSPCQYGYRTSYFSTFVKIHHQSVIALAIRIAADAKANPVGMRHTRFATTTDEKADVINPKNTQC